MLQGLRCSTTGCGAQVVVVLKASSLSNITFDLTDRSCTSSFDFAGDKFEFCTVGSKPIHLEASSYLVEKSGVTKCGLPSIICVPAVYDELLKLVSSELLTAQVVILILAKLDSHHHILMELYTANMLVESHMLLSITQVQVFPAAF
ncbi:hypothetical protein H4R35_000217 [Dimargaris xerosporica]|nr:hypothetical protein H4R35_000217 [Dimargaris xerosporica]